MTYKEFNTWCNQRACDGRWGMNEAMMCCDIITRISKETRKKYKFLWKFKLEKTWQELTEERECAEIIVSVTNKKIAELIGAAN